MNYQLWNQWKVIRESQCHNLWRNNELDEWFMCYVIILRNANVSVSVLIALFSHVYVTCKIMGNWLNGRVDGLSDLVRSSIKISVGPLITRGRALKSGKSRKLVRITDRWFWIGCWLITWLQLEDVSDHSDPV